jgi:ABC-type uncharacterized transport system permease subunit
MLSRRARGVAREARSTITAMTSLRALPLIVRWAAIGAVSAAVVGAVVGLVVGLSVHPATAWFAVYEVGIPAAILGGLLGLASGAIANAVQWTARRARTPNLESNR